MMKQVSYSPALTVQKAFRILELLGEKQPARPAELIQQIKISRSNLYRLLATLQKNRLCTSKVIAAISISAPAVRLTMQKIEKLRDQLIEAALKISKKLGYTGANKTKGI